MPLALITGASRGLGLALAAALSSRGWSLLLDAREGATLRETTARLPTKVIAVQGDVTNPSHRADLVGHVVAAGGLDLLVNNASSLGPVDQGPALRPLAGYPLDQLQQLFEVNVLAPLALVQSLLPHLRARHGVVMNVSSDAALKAYPGWGGYGASKAALDQLTRVLGVEEPEVAWYAVDPGDMRTAMHQAAFPGEDISDRPEPDTAVPALLRLLRRRPANGRYRAADLLVPGAGT